MQKTEIGRADRASDYKYQTSIIASIIGIRGLGLICLARVAFDISATQMFPIFFSFPLNEKYT